MNINDLNLNIIPLKICIRYAFRQFIAFHVKLEAKIFKIKSINTLTNGV